MNTQNATQKYTDSQNSLFIIINIILLGLITWAGTDMTINFYGGMGTGNVKADNIIFGLVNDCCKIFFPVLIGIAIEKKKYMHTAVLVAVIGMTIYISYNASQGQDLNTSNKQILSSSQKDSIIENKKEKQAELKKLEAKEKSLVGPIQAEIKSKPANYITAKANLRKDIVVIVNRYSALSKPIQKQIDTYTTKIQNYKVDTTLTTEGFHSLSKFTGVEVGELTKQKNMAVEILSLILSFNLGLLLGKSNTDLFKLAKKGYSKLKDGMKKEEVIDTAQETIDILHSPPNKPAAETAKIIDMLKLQFSDEQINEYITYMFSPFENGENPIQKRSPGTGKFETNTSLSNKQIKGIRYILELSNVVRVNDNFTTVLMSKNDAFKTVNM